MAKKKEKCICDQCPRRFVCFTQKKVFSDPAYQAMYEAHVDEGRTHEEAVAAVREFIEAQKELEVNPPPRPRKPHEFDDWRIGPIIRKEHSKPDSGWYSSSEQLKTMPVEDAKKELDKVKRWERTW